MKHHRFDVRYRFNWAPPEPGDTVTFVYPPRSSGGGNFFLEAYTNVDCDGLFLDVIYAVISQCFDAWLLLTPDGGLKELRFV